MRIREIILEAPQQMPNFGTAGQQYNVNYKLNGVSTPAKGAAPKVDLKTRPIDILSKSMPGKVKKAQSVAAKSWNGFKSTKVSRLFGAKLVAPIAIWLDDMSAINEMWESGYFNSYGNKAGEVAQQMRTAHTQLLFSRMATGYLAWFAVAKATGAAARALMFLIPGLGWLAGTASVVAQTVMFALLQSDAVQKFITLKIIENIPYLDDLSYSAAKWVSGEAGVWIPEIINQYKKQYIGAAADTVVKNTPQSVKSAVGAVGAAADTVVKNTPQSVKSAAKGFTDRVGITKTEPLSAMSDIAKDF
jgi:hypothetical protein